MTPDPVPNVARCIDVDDFDPDAVLVFEGDLAGRMRPHEVSAVAWQFESINRGYREYTSFSKRVLKQIGRRALPLPRLQTILGEDRKQWWSAVLRDPLLPKALHPKGYLGPAAWQERQRLLKRLHGTPDSD